MPEVKIVKNDFATLYNQLKPGGDRYKKVRTSFIKMVVEQENEFRNDLPEGATSILKNSAFSDINIAGHNLIGKIGAKAQYSKIAASTGRRPGKMPPYKELERWAAKKLGNKKLAFVVARKIKKKGTKRYIEKGPDLVEKRQNRIQNFSVPLFLRKAGEIITK
jgi:hypothetical protein